MTRPSVTMRRDISGFDIRWDEARADAARASGAWTDRTIADYARERAETEPSKVLVVDGETEYSAADIYRDAQRLARALVQRGLRPGMTISFQLPNWYEAVVVSLAAAMAGLVINPIVPIYREHEVSFILEDSRSRLIFIPASFRGFDYRAMLRRIAAGRPIDVIVVRGEGEGFGGWDALLAEAREDTPLPAVDPDAIKTIMYTSGTTGRAKGVIHSHNTLQAENQARRRYFALGPDDVMFNPSPVTHVTGTLYSLCVPFTLGVTTVMMDSWDAARALDAMRRRGVTGMVASTIFLDELVTVARTQGECLPSLRFFLCGGASVPPQLIREASELFPHCMVSRLYGATEVPCITAGVRGRDDIEHGATTDGEIFGCEVRIVDPATGDLLPPEVEGEMVARGPQMLLGYTRADDNAAAFDAEGYFRMGDLGRIADGHYAVVTGRKKDLIIRAGENISPKEIEDILLTHPAIADIAIVAIPDKRTGEAACAFVILNDGHALDLPEVARFLDRAGTARQKIPERLELVAEFPRTSIGKVRKDLLREAARALVDN